MLECRSGELSPVLTKPRSQAPVSTGGAQPRETSTPEAYRGRVTTGSVFRSMTDDLPTARTMQPQSAWLCLLLWYKACYHQAPADLQALVDAGHGDMRLSRLRFRSPSASAGSPTA